MKTIEVLNNVPEFSEILKLAGDENIIVKTQDGREFIVAEVDDFEEEIELVRQNNELMEFLKQRSKKDNTYSLDEVRQQLNLMEDT